MIVTHLALLMLAEAPLTASGTPKLSYPCTMYKAADIARAKQNIARHDWGKKVYARIKANARYYLKMDRDRLRSFVSERTPLVTVKCPKCGNGPWYAYRLINNGDTLQCKSCRTTWDWDSSEGAETWNIHGVIRPYRLTHILSAVADAGIAYQIDGDPRYAEKAAVLVERFAEVFKGYRTNMVNRNKWCDNHPYLVALPRRTSAWPPGVDAKPEPLDPDGFGVSPRRGCDRRHARGRGETQAGRSDTLPGPPTGKASRPRFDFCRGLLAV